MSLDMQGTYLPVRFLAGLESRERDGLVKMRAVRAVSVNLRIFRAGELHKISQQILITLIK